MNEPYPPTPPPPPTAPPPVAPPPPPAKKKGLSPLAWVGIGCGVLLLIGLVVMLAGGLFVFGKAKEKMGELEKNPTLAGAEMMIRMNPDLELVEKDVEAGTLTVRDKKSGEEYTVDLEDIEEGRISFESGGKRSDIRFGTGEGDEGVLEVTGEDGETTFRMGGAGATEVPGWVPMYPGTTPEGGYSMSSGGEHTGGFNLVTRDRVGEVLDFYAEWIGDELGVEADRSTYSSGGRDGGIVTGRKADESRQLSATVSSEGGQTSVLVTYVEKG